MGTPYLMFTFYLTSFYQFYPFLPFQSLFILISMLCPIKLPLFILFSHFFLFFALFFCIWLVFQTRGSRFQYVFLLFYQINCYYEGPFYIQIIQFVSQNKQTSLSMISASLDISDQISVLRAETVKKIIGLEPQICQISRRELFMAVTLLDNYLLAKKKNGPSNIENSSLFSFSLCICCIRLACKYEAQIAPKISELAELLQYDGDIKVLSLLCLKTQAEVLASIDFIMPQETFYTSFESKVEVASLSRQQRAYFLKLFLFGIEFSTELTQKSDYGARILEYLKYKKRQDSQIAEYIEQVKKWGKQKN